jgi:DtxR family Mn-dependent transcriptional regulator
LEKRMTTSAVEDYLKTIYDMEQGGERATTSALAARLGVQPASVTGMVKRLAESALVSYTPYGGADLTAAGRRTALSVARHHRVVERFLVDTLGVPWDEVHDAAHKLEHALSDALVDRIAAFLGHPTTCPHGSPIPSFTGEIAEVTHVALAELPAGQSAVVSEVDDEDAAFLRYLGELGLVPGAEVEILDIAPFDGPLTFRVAGQMRSAGTEVTRRVWVRSASAASSGATERDLHGDG